MWNKRIIRPSFPPHFLTDRQTYLNTICRPINSRHLNGQSGAGRPSTGRISSASGFSHSQMLGSVLFFIWFCDASLLWSNTAALVQLNYNAQPSSVVGKAARDYSSPVLPVISTSKISQTRGFSKLLSGSQQIESRPNITSTPWNRTNASLQRLQK